MQIGTLPIVGYAGNYVFLSISVMIHSWYNVDGIKVGCPDGLIDCNSVMEATNARMGLAKYTDIIVGKDKEGAF